MTVSGAYGRDYKSAKEIKADWSSGKDFVIRSLEGSGYVNNADVEPSMEVWGRYSQDRKIVRLQ